MGEGRVRVTAGPCEKEIEPNEHSGRPRVRDHILRPSNLKEISAAMKVSVVDRDPRVPSVPVWEKARMRGDLGLKVHS